MNCTKKQIKMRPRRWGHEPVVLATLILLGLSLFALPPSPARAEGADYYRHCGKIENVGPKKGGLKFSAFEVSCGRARKIVKAFLRTVAGELNAHKCDTPSGCNATIAGLKCDTGGSAGACESSPRECNCESGKGINFKYRYFWDHGKYWEQWGY